MKEFNPDYIVWELTCRQDESNPERFFDHPEDAKAARKAIEDGDEWGWGLVKIVGRHVHPNDPLQTLEAVDYLGACSYKDRQDFINDGYYRDMKRNVTQVLRAKWEAAQR